MAIRILMMDGSRLVEHQSGALTSAVATLIGPDIDVTATQIAEMGPSLKGFVIRPPEEGLFVIVTSTGSWEQGQLRWG